MQEATRSARQEASRNITTARTEFEALARVKSPKSCSTSCGNSATKASTEPIQEIQRKRAATGKIQVIIAIQGG